MIKDISNSIDTSCTKSHRRPAPPRPLQKTHRHHKKMSSSPGGEEEDPENYPWHLAKAALLALITTSFLVWQQTRHSFYLARTAFVEHRRRSNRRDSAPAPAPAAASTTAKRRANKPNPKKAKKTASSSTMVDDDGGGGGDDDDDGGTLVVGFFHPRCSSGGGGERVLWKSIQALGELREGKFPASTKRRPRPRRGGSATAAATTTSTTTTTTTTDPPPPPHSRDVLANVRNLCVVVYTIDEPSDDYDRTIAEDVRARFNIVVPSSLPVHFVHLHELRHLLGE